MKPETYDWVWKQIQSHIVRIPQEIEQNSPGSLVRQRFELTYGDKTKSVIYGQYVKIRDDLKAKCYSFDSTSQIPDLIDHHKIAACLCKAFIQKKVFMFDATDSAPIEMLRSNYNLAYNASLQIIYIYLLEYYYRYRLKNCFDRLKKQKTLIAPPTTEGHDNYHLGRVKTLALNDYYGVDFDLLNFSSVMYWIEFYNRQLLEENHIISAMKLDDNHQVSGS